MSPDVRPRTVVSPPDHVGRTREFAALGEALAEPPAVVLVEGEAGIGKSRLVREFFDSAAGSPHRCLVAVCPPFREPYTLAPVVDAVRQARDSVRGLRLTGLAGALRPLFPEWAADLPPAPEPLDDATAARHRLFCAFAELLDRLRVTVLVAEDVHWADDATLEFLLFLVSRRPQPLSIVVTHRPDELPADSLLRRLSSRLGHGVTQRRLVLGPLGVTETAAVVSSMLAGQQVSAHFAAFLHERTDGVPLAIEESVRLLQERADLFRKDGAWVRRRLDHIEVPPTIRDAVLERVGRLAADAQTVLRAAAVLTDPADDLLLTAVAGLPADHLAAGRAEVLGCGLLTEDSHGLVSFRHSLACQAVYEATPVQQRRALHLRAGRTLEGLAEPPLAQLARHYRQAGNTEAWCHYAERAADRALQTGDEAGEAVLLHSLVTTIALPVEQLPRLVSKIQFQCLPGPDPFSAVVDTLRSALRTAGLTPDQEAAVRFELGRALWASGRCEAGRPEFELAVPRLRPDSLEAARARILLGIPIGDVRLASEHLRWLREAPPLPYSFSPRERLRLQVDRTDALLLLGEEQGWAEAQKIPADPSGPAEAAYVTLAHMNIGNAALLWGRYDETRRRLARARNLVNKYQFLEGYLGVIAAIQLHLDWFTGAWRGLADRATSMAEQDEALLPDRCEAALVAGLMLASTGDQRKAEEWLHFARGHEQQRIESAAALAALWLPDDRIDEALEITVGPIDIGLAKGIWPQATELAPVRIDALVAAGRLDEAGELVAIFERTLGDRDAPAAQASLMLCRAVLTEAKGRQTQAAGLFARAAAAWRVLPRPYYALRSGERQARCLLAAGQAEAGLSVLAGVLRGLSGLGALHDVERVRLILRRHGVPTSTQRRVGRPSYGDQLSPRELEVVRLLVGGRTNRRIADVLMVSTPTVASQVKSAMRKLRVDSRTALAVKAVELGLVSDEGLAR